MTTPWQLRDYVFAAFMTIGMVLTAIIVGLFTPPGVQLLAWAPLGAIFLTLGMARPQRRGSVGLMILPLALLLGLLHPPITFIMTLYLSATVLVTEAVMFFVGTYRSKRNRLLGNLLFFASASLWGLFVAALFLKGAKAESLAKIVGNPGLVVGITLAVAAAGAVGWWLGELAVKQLRKAGKIDVES